MISKRIIFCIFSAFIIDGCTISHREDRFLTAKEAADQLDNIPIGLNVSDIGIVQKYAPSDMEIINTFKVQRCLIINPIKLDKYVVLYRQRPPGIIMSLSESDRVIQIPIVEDYNLNGQVFVFFNAQNRYKGYYAWSDWRISKDDNARWQAEKSEFVSEGVENECVLYEANASSQKETLEKLFQLPLYLHINSR